MKPPERLSTPRHGVALPLLLFVLLVLTALATMSIRTAERELVVARASLRLLQARLGAEGGVRLASEGVASGPLRELWREGGPGVVLEGELTAGSRFVVRAGRVLHDYLLVEGIGLTGGGEGGEARSGRILWLLDAARELAALPAAVTHGGVLDGEGATGGEVATAPAAWDPWICDAHRATIDALFPLGTVAPAVHAPGAAPALGILDVPRLLERADRRLEGTWTPAPEERAGACASDVAANWGSPSDPSGVCGAHLPLVASAGSLRMVGGEGQGVLAVEESLELRDGARFTGLVLVGGDLTLGGGARVEGFVRAGGRVALSGGARVVAAACPVLRSLTGNPSLLEPVPPAAASWLGPF